MVQSLVKPTLLADFLALPENKPACEFINGRVVPAFVNQLQLTIKGLFG